jgi:two-component system chemotaxis response regulator CheB
LPTILFFSEPRWKKCWRRIRISRSWARCGTLTKQKKKIKLLSPDVVSLDIEMPGLSGIEFVKKIMPIHPVPIILVSALTMTVFEALASGAVDFVRKPNIQEGSDLRQFYRELSNKIHIAAHAKVKRASLPAASAVSDLVLKHKFTDHFVIAIGASTGGTEATLDVLKRLPENVPGILITQHMPPNFTDMYARRLDKICKIAVKEAANGDRLEKGHAYIAPGDKQMTLEKDERGYYIKCAAGVKVSGHCPSVDVLFKSVAEKAGQNAIGVIMTGMGRDGAEGLLKMKQKGAYTIGQDQESCVVYGMPMVAFNIGAVSEQAACQDIAGLIINHLNY